MKKYKREIIGLVIVGMIGLVVAGILKYTNILSYKYNDLNHYQSNNLKLQFDYPENWKIDKKQTDTSETIIISSDNDNAFEVYITGEKLIPKDENYITYPRKKYSFESTQLNTISLLDNKSLVISDLGGIEIQQNDSIYDDIIISKELIKDKKYFVYEEKEGTIYEDLAIYGYYTDDVHLTIQYEVNSEDVIKDWGAYTVMLDEMVDSIKSFNSEKSIIFNEIDKTTQYKSKEFNIVFDYPSTWNRSVQIGDESSSIVLTSDADNSFEVRMTKIIISDNNEICEPYTPCDTAYPRIPFKYKADDFKKITTLDGVDIVISALGGVNRDIGETTDFSMLTAVNFTSRDQGSIYGVEDNLLYEDLAIYNYIDDNIRFEILYSINSDDVIDDWSIYESELQKIISSIYKLD